MDTYTLITEKEDIGSRIDTWIAWNIEDMTRSGVQKLIEQGNITINDHIVKNNYRLRLGDVAKVLVPEAVPVEILAEDIPLDILYEDEDVIVLNKPQGMVVHPAAGHLAGTVVNALLYHCKGQLSGINGVMRPGIVHRIDKDTSGVIMAAKNNMAHQSLAKQLAEHSITRKYTAVVFGKLQEESGTVDQPIARSSQDRKKMAVVPGGRHAVTHYKVIERLGKYTVIEAQLETGRTHQIRVHMSYIGHPLVGDTVYGTKRQPVNLLGQALHARVLGFVHPRTGQYMEFEAVLPAYFDKLILKLKNLSQV